MFLDRSSKNGRTGQALRAGRGEKCLPALFPRARLVNPVWIFMFVLFFEVIGFVEVRSLFFSR